MRRYDNERWRITNFGRGQIHSLRSIFFRGGAASSSSFSSYDTHAGWMTFAENGGFLMALLFAHFISSRVHRRVTRAHRLADSLPCTCILKNNREFDLCLYIQKFKLWNLLGQICGKADPNQAKNTNKLLNICMFHLLSGCVGNITRVPLYHLILI